MIKVEHTEVFNFEGAIRGLRNPMNSWDKSDSGYNCVQNNGELCDPHCTADNYCDTRTSKFMIGKNDLDLMRRLYKAGVEHRTYARMIQVSMDIIAPLYWWKEMDRYTVGKTQVSTSTMHKIHSKEFTLDDFSNEHLTTEPENFIHSGKTVLQAIIDDLNAFRVEYLLTKDKKYWWQIIQLLPSSYNQRRTVTMSYETVFKIISERSNHKLDEWRDFCKILLDLPYIRSIIE